MSEEAPPVAETKAKPDLEAEIRAKIDKEIAERKSDKADAIDEKNTIDPSKTAVIEAEVRKKLDEEIKQRQADKEKADAAKAKEDDAKSDPEKAKTGKTDDEDKGDKDKTDKDKATPDGAEGKKTGTRKRKRPRKKVGGQKRSQLTEREQKIMEEKAAIDAKLKKRNLYLYAAISGVFLIGLGVLFVIANRQNQGAPGGTSSPSVNQVAPPSFGGSGSGFKSSSTFKKATEGAKALIQEQNYQGAIDHYKAHMEQYPKDAAACERAIAQIDSIYINPAPLPPPDPEAQRETRWDRETRKERRERRNRQGDDAFDDFDEDLELPDDEPAAGGADAGGDPFGGGLFVDDKALLDEPEEEKEKPADPFGELDNLLE